MRLPYPWQHERGNNPQYLARYEPHTPPQSSKPPDATPRQEPKDSATGNRHASQKR